MKQLEQSRLTCIFCDDIRDELSGKTNIIGWFPSDNIVLNNNEPLVLPTLCVLCLLIISADKTTASMKVEMLQGETVLQSMNVPIESLEQMKEVFAKDAKDREIRIAMKLIGFQVNESTSLRVRVTMDGQVIEGNALRFVRQV